MKPNQPYKRMLALGLALLLATALSAQSELRQTIRGRVVDDVTGYPLPGANVILRDAEPVRGTSTDADGLFALTDIPLGRQSLEIRFIGYETRTLPNLYLSSGKEVQVEIRLVELTTSMEEVTVTYEKRKDEAQNELAMVSARTFSVEETERFAGSLGDPARMVANYAGVMTQNDSRNDLIIRGNSPIGVLWRLEGVEIPNPNHFGALGTTGGPVSMVNNNLLMNSDFLTGAFPAEFGNATAGVFDLNLRSGNKAKTEFTGQVGFNGFEAGLEGPFSKKEDGHKASYLANYRYSTLGLIHKIGFEFGTGTAIPQYQDLTFLVDVPTEKSGRWKLYGLWGTSAIELGRDLADQEGNSYNGRGTATDFGSSLGVVALSNTSYLTQDLRLRSTLSYQQTGSYTIHDSVRNQGTEVIPFVRSYSTEEKLSFSTQLRHKINARTNYSLGVILDLYRIDYLDSVHLAEYGRFITDMDVRGDLGMVRGYTQVQHSLGERWKAYAGLHLLHFGLSGESALEPRASLALKTSERGTLSLGYGLHSQVQPKSVYFFRTYLEESDSYLETNRNLGLTKSHHLVLGFNQLLTPNFRVKLESYYQSLYHIPVSPSQGAYSMINAGDFFNILVPDSLENTGTGRNYGLELTLEKFLDKGFYFLFTTSLFDSKYKGTDGILRNTAFNGNYVFNLLTGYERRVGNNAYLTVDVKGVWAGGRRYVPLDVEATLASGEEVRDWENAYRDRYGDYFRTDLRLGLKLNHRKFTQEWAIDFQNLTNHQSLFMEGFDFDAGEVYRTYQQGFYPMFLYRLQF
ncbi:MAG: TonB-dependent receptor [Bacteroidales bacterium]